VSATPTFNRLLRALTIALALAAWGGGPARAEDDGAGFFSYLPAPPNLHLPNLDIVPFWTSDLKVAKKAYKKGEYDRALKYFRKASDDGNIVADWYLGHMYRMGKGISRDDATAYSYYSRVADAFDPEEQDQNRLRVMVDAVLRVADYRLVGIPEAGVPRDYDYAARTYLRMATTYGHPAAQYALGLMNIEGQGLKSNPQQGLKWMMAAARKRYAPSEAYLGDLYWTGRIVEQDRTRALMWYILAKDSEKAPDGPDIESRYNQLLASATDEERLEAEARARVWSDRYPAGPAQ
jgi:uncharacterized protein